MVELLVLKLFVKEKELYEKYNDVYKNTSQDKEISLLFSLIGRYYSLCKEHSYISQDELLALYHTEYPNHKNKEMYVDLISKLYALETSRDLAEEYMSRLVERDYSAQMLEELLPVVGGHKHGTGFEGIRSLLEDYDVRSDRVVEESPIVKYDLEDLLVQTEGDGMAFRLKCLRDALGGLAGGTLGHVFARPETGKTSFMHSEATFLAPQLSDDHPLLWFNNEEAASRVLMRQYTALTGITEAEIRRDPSGARAMFDAHGGRRLLLIDDAALTVEYVEKMCREYTPRFVVIDQGDKLQYKGASKAGNGADRLKGVYDNLREVVKRCDKQWTMDMLTVGQADAAAENKRVLSLGNLDSGKTGKAGAFDYVIGIGCDLGNQSARYVTMCKNKIKGVHGTRLVSFDPTTGRYTD